MAVRRNKDIVTRVSENYKKTVFQDYSELTEGVYTYITYYQINDAASKQDYALEAVHSLTGNNAPLTYNRIYDVPLYGVDPMMIQNDIAERGMMSTINGEGTFIPDTVVPVAGEFFIFDLDDLRTHLFQVTDVQFSDTGPMKYYKIQFTLYHENDDVILNNVAEDYQMMQDQIGTSNNTVLKKVEAVQAEEAQAVIDDIITDYFDTYYDQDMNVFVYRSGDVEGNIYWSPFLQHFLCKNSVMVKHSKKLMECIYLMDVDKYDAKELFDEKAYRKSIFKSVEVKKNMVAYDSTYMFRGMDNLRTRNLPFFFSTDNYVPLDNARLNSYMYLYGFPFTVANEDNKFATADKWHKFYAPEDLDDEERLEHLKLGDVLYQMENESSLYPVECYYITNDGNVISASLPDMLASDNEDFADLFLFDIVRKYIKKELVLTDELISKLQDYYYEESVYNYIYLPLVIYIIKEKIKEIFN